MRLWIKLTTWLFAGALAPAGLAQTPCPAVVEAVSFQTSDGFTLRGEVLSPCGTKAGETLPAVLFINPFGQSFQTYRTQAEALVADGFRTLSYDPRGWQSSEGQTTLDYHLLTGDTMTAVDWLTAHYKTSRIGATGISEGGGLSLLLAAADARISAVASLSGWTDMNHPSFGGTPRLAWNLILQTMLIVFGDPTAIIEEAIKQASSEAPPPPADPAPQIRSMSAWYQIKEINAHKTAVMLAHSLDDTLFPVNQVFDFYANLEGPRHLEIHRGFHAAAEIVGIRDPAKEPWAGMRQFFHDHVKDGAASSLDQVVAISYKNQEGTLQLPSQERLKAGQRTFYAAHTGSGAVLADAPTASTDANELRIVSLPVDPSGVTTGVPLLSALDNLLNLATVKEPVRDIPRPYALAFVTAPLQRSATIFGPGRVSLKLNSTNARGLVVAHLVDVGPEGQGELITHGVYTWGAADRNSNKQVEFSIELYATAWHLAQDHQLALVLNSQDSEYLAPTYDTYEYALDGAAGSAKVEVQLLAD